MSGLSIYFPPKLSVNTINASTQVLADQAQAPGRVVSEFVNSK